MDMIGKSNLNSTARDAYRLKTKKQMTVFNVSNKIADQSDDSTLVRLAGGPNKGTPELTAKMQMMEESSSIKATADILAGEVIMAERPLVVALLPREKRAEDGDKEVWLPHACPYTMLPMPAAVPCKLGSAEMFANEAARDAAEVAFHAREWRVRGFLERSGATPLVMLALRVALYMYEGMESEKLSALLAKANKGTKDTYMQPSLLLSLSGY